MKRIQHVLVVGAEAEVLHQLTLVLEKEGVEVTHEQRPTIHPASEGIDVVISFSDNKSIEWNVMRELSEELPLVLLSNDNNKVTAIGSDFADAWLSLEDINQFLYKAALKAIERREISKPPVQGRIIRTA